MYKVLDTNVLLLDAHNITKLSMDGSIIVLPETVIDEIDSKKTGFSELAYQAREVGRIITKARNIGVTVKDDLTIVSFLYDTTQIQVVSTSTYPDFKDTSPSIVNDRKIIEIALQYCNLYGNDLVRFVSNDAMCRIRAESVGITVEDVKDVDNLDLVFTKTLAIDSPDIFSNLHIEDILQIDPEYRPENYNYKFIDSSGQVKLATIANGLINVIGRDTEDRLRAQEVNPVNADQLFMAYAIQNPQVDIITVEALSGSGKTLTALSNAMKLVGTNTPYKGIIYVRSSVNDVDDAEEVGFLPGLETKFEPFLHPFYDSLDFIVRNKYKNSKEKGEELEQKIEEAKEAMISKFNMQAMTTLGMRGRTFTDSVIIIDEVQNISRLQLQKLITRVGKNCKVILIGSNRQIDNKYLSKYTNGLSVILDACRHSEWPIKLHAVTLSKVVRSPIAEFAETIFTKANK